MSATPPATATSVLVVDDEPQLRHALSVNLRARGYVVHQAGTGNEALRATADTRPDAVILDLGLPDVDGVEGRAFARWTSAYRRWLQQGYPLIKAIGALPGERYCVTNRALYIDGHRRGPVFTVDDQGLPLPKLRGCFTVPRGEFLPLGTHSPKSFDGRYFGTVPLTLIRYRAVPLWTF